MIKHTKDSLEKHTKVRLIKHMKEHLLVSILRLILVTMKARLKVRLTNNMKDLIINHTQASIQEIKNTVANPLDSLRVHLTKIIQDYLLSLDHHILKPMLANIQKHIQDSTRDSTLNNILVYMKVRLTKHI